MAKIKKGIIPIEKLKKGTEVVLSVNHVLARKGAKGRISKVFNNYNVYSLELKDITISVHHTHIKAVL